MNIVDFVSYFEVKDVSPPGWPVVCNVVVPNDAALEAVPTWPAAALSSAGRVGSGRGVTPRDALESGLGSAFELASACRWPDLDVTRASASALEGHVWDAAMLSGFSQDQRTDAATWNSALAGVDAVLTPGSGPAEWVRGHGIDGQPVWMPADAVYISDVPGDTYALADTNGCAAGETDNAARTAALFELIERDATGRWWYGNRARPALEPAALSDDVAACVAACHAAGITTRLVNITSDLEVPCVAAIGESAAGHIACGFAAAARFDTAAMKAVTEMAQMFLVIRGGLAGAAFRPGLDRWLTEVKMACAPLARIMAPAGVPDTPSRIGTRFADAGVRVAFVNITRPEFGVPVWRAVSPDLCHWKPRFGRDRLLQPDRHDAAPPAATPNAVLLRL